MPFPGSGWYGRTSAGEVAGRLAVEAVKDFSLNSSKSFSSFQPDKEEDTLKECEEAFLHANAQIVGETAKHLEWRGMGTTLTMAFAVDWTLFVAHAGHSRCYLFSNGKLSQLTQDHTFAAELVDLGVFSPKSAAHHFYRHVVSNVLRTSRACKWNCQTSSPRR